MVILIGGVGCAGKTVLAQRLLEKYHMPYLSIDHLKMGIIRGTDSCGFCAGDSDELISGKLWGIVKGIIMTNLENGQHIIIEGCYLRPGDVAALPDEYKSGVIAVYMGFSASYVNECFQSGIVAHASEIERRGEDNVPSSELAEESAALKAECEKHGAKYFEIDHDYGKATDAIFEWLGGEIAKTLPRCARQGFICERGANE